MPRDAKESTGAGAVATGALEGLAQEVPLEGLEIDAVGGQLEGAGPRR